MDQTVISPNDRDFMIRTVIGEAADQPDVGQAAVAHVIMNRVKAGYGKTPTNVVLAPGQFEPWQTRSNQLLSINPKSPIYQQTGQIVDGVVNGDIPDPTEGKTHFLQPNIVMQRYGRLPDWARSGGQRIGDHVFYAPNGPVMGTNETSDVPYTPDDFLKKYGSQAPAAAPAPVQQEPSQSTKYTAQDFLSKYGSTAPVAAQPQPISAMQAGSHIPIPTEAMTPQQKADQIEAFKRGQQDYGVAQKISEGDYSPLTKNLQPGMTQAGQGFQELFHNAPASGLGDIGMGLLSVASSPFSEATRFMGNVIGNPQAATVASLALPGPKTIGSVNALRPSVNALHDIVRDIGAENLPSAIERMEANPRLSPVDVSANVRAQTQGLAANPSNPEALSIVNKAVEQRQTTTKAAASAAADINLGKLPNVADTINGLKQDARNVGTTVIEPALAKAQPIGAMPLLQQLDSIVSNPALSDAAKVRLNGLKQQVSAEGPQGFLDPKTVHKLQFELREEAQTLQASATGSDRLMSRPLYQMRENLINSIDNASGGTYRPALKNYADEKQVEAAFNKGLGVFNNAIGPKAILENHPDMWQQWANDASANEIAAVNKGIRVAMDAKISNIRSGVAGAVPEEGFTADKIRAVNPQNADTFIRQLNDERDIALGNTALIGGSQTAVRMLGAQKRQVREVPSLAQSIKQNALPIGIMGALEAGSQYAGMPGLGMALAAAGGTVSKTTQKLMQLSERASNANYAKYATAQGTDRNELLSIMKQAAAAHQASQGNKLGNLIPSMLRLAAP